MILNIKKCKLFTINLIIFVHHRLDPTRQTQYPYFFLFFKNLTEADELNDSESEFGVLSAVMKMMSGSSWKKRPSSGMFMRLFRY